MTKTQLKVIELARKYIHKCHPENKSLHFSCLVIGDFIVCHGINKENHLLEWIQFRKKSLHSEHECIRKFRRMRTSDEINKLDLYNIRLTRWGDIRCAKPCQRCQKMLSKIEIKPRKIFYTTDEGVFTKL